MKKIISIIILLAVIGITGIYIGQSYAKYKTEIPEKAGTATVAKWAFSAGSGTTFDIVLNDTYDSSTLTSGRIAPGTSGSFAIEVSNTGSEVGASYEVTIGSGTNVPSNLKFYTSYTNSTTNTPVPNDGKFTGTLNPGSSDTITIYWVWPYETESGDVADTNSGTTAITSAQMTIPVSIVGTQVLPN